MQHKMFRLTRFGVLVLLSLAQTKNLIVINSHDPGSCSKSNHGEIVLVQDREERDTILVCTKNKGIYTWKTTDNSRPSGEYFEPGYDCLDILNKNTKAKSGYYWVDFKGGKAIKVYCDMTTDGGGYMLFGRMNNTVMWNVPSSDKTVEPFGFPQWSSELGDVSVLDFRIQIASDDSFDDTKAHWAYRFKNKRKLSDLLIVDQGGCGYHVPGVGDVSYIKDLLTEEIITKEFSCSKFGPYSHPAAKTGWTMMNLCLEKPCRLGFAYHGLYPVQVYFSGGFSYVITAKGTKSGTTAFFGCENGKCCACYGPKGGRDIYCLKECQPTNGGTVTKHASAWFWVRLNPPRKVWEKCMEYKSEEENGDSVWYKLVGDRNIPVRGRCGKRTPLITDGVVVLEDEKSFKKVPAVNGIIVYHKDNQSMQVRMNNSWKALAQEEMVSEIDERLKRLTKLVEDRYFHNVSCKLLAAEKPSLPSGIYFTGSRKVYCDIPSGWTLVARFSNTDKQNWMSNANFWYDKISDYGVTIDPSVNLDMFSEAFWKMSANEIKITRSDDPSHVALLQTTNNCLKGKTFRQFITSFGNFRNGAVWASNACRGNCAIQYGGKYQSTTGFNMHGCTSDIQSGNYIGFWCAWSSGDGAVMMIGGGGSSCKRADHGIGVTEEDRAKFGGTLGFMDFGFDVDNSQSYQQNEIQRSYALNLWVR